MVALTNEKSPKGSEWGGGGGGLPETPGGRRLSGESSPPDVGVAWGWRLVVLSLGILGASPPY